MIYDLTIMIDNAPPPFEQYPPMMLPRMVTLQLYKNLLHTHAKTLDGTKPHHHRWELSVIVNCAWWVTTLSQSKRPLLGMASKATHGRLNEFSNGLEIPTCIPRTPPSAKL